MKSFLSLFKNKLLVATTIIPTGISIIYFGLIASDVYISESRFVVRSPERQATSALGLMLKGAGFSKAQDDSYTVQDYVLSRDALYAVNNELKIKEEYSSTNVDLFSRFSIMGLDDSMEDFYLYYQKKVNIQLDPTSSISTLTVKAFTPEMAVKTNQLLVELAEKLVNQLNERGRQDMVRFAAAEVADAQVKAKAAAIALSEYRSAKGVIDPEKQTTIPLQQVGKLQEELVATRSQLAQLEKLVKDNPQIPVLKQRVILIEGQINEENKRVTGGERSLAGKAAEYQRLILEKEFSDKMLASAMSSLEQAKNEAQRKQLYLERIVQPNQPDHALEPQRLRNILAIFILGLITWGILSMLIAGVKEHQE